MRVRHVTALFTIVTAVFMIVFILHHAEAQSDSPVISDVAVTDVAATSTTITWTTNTDTDSYLNVSEDTNYCGVEDTGPLSLSHSVVIPNLSPGTTYFVRIRSTDVNANQSFSGDYTFTTTSSVDLSSITNVQQKNLAAQAVNAIQQITNPQALAVVAQTLSSQAAANVGPPKILGDPQLTIGSDNVVITWNTDQESNGQVGLVSDADYNPNAANPYTQEDEDTNTDTTTHAVTVYGLVASTLYHYQVSSQGAIGSPGTSGDLTFTTKAVLPTILNPHLVDVGEHAATVAWATPFPTAGTVEYTNTNARTTLSAGDPTFLVTHSVLLTNLIFQTRYSVVIEATDQASDTVASPPLYFVTTKNLNPPVISQVNNDSTLYPGEDTTVQTVVSWQTDEPAQCNLSYSSGVATAAGVASTSLETAPLTKHVAVITNFQPATVYKYWVTCTDADGNTTSSEQFVLLTPEQEKSIIDIIIENFQGTFGWLGNFGGGAKK